MNQAGEGKASEKVPKQPLVFDDGGIVSVVNFTAPVMVDSFTIKLNWMGISDAQGYRITYLDAMHVPVKITVQKPSALSNYKLIFNVMFKIRLTCIGTTFFSTLMKLVKLVSNEIKFTIA